MSPQLIILVGAVLSFAHITAASGECSETQQENELQKCEKNFVDAMIQDSKANCTAEVKNMHECLEKLSKKCYPNVNEKVIKQVVSVGMKQIQALRFYCTDTKLNYTWSNIAPSIKNKLPSCAVTFDETANQCSKNFRLEMQKNPKDSAALYRTYEDSNKCLQHCALTNGTSASSTSASSTTGTNTRNTALKINTNALMLLSIALMTLFSKA